jgi:hypothetical protein
MFGGAPVGAALVQILQRAGLNKGAIGVLGLDPYPPFYFDGPMPCNTWKTVQDSLPEARFKRLGPQFLQMILEVARSNWRADRGHSDSCGVLPLRHFSGREETEWPHQPGPTSVQHSWLALS